MLDTAKQKDSQLCKIGIEIRRIYRYNNYDKN